MRFSQLHVFQRIVCDHNDAYLCTVTIRGYY